MLKKAFIFCALLLTCQLLMAQPIPSSPFEIIESVPKETIFGKDQLRRTQTVWLEMINRAQKSIDLGAFYFESKTGESLTAIIEALKHAAQRGVKIRIIIGSVFEKESLKTLIPLEHQKNIRIRIMPMQQLTGSIMHAKYFIIDGKSCFIGSQNFDWRALDQIHEIGVRIDNKTFAQTILSIFNLDWQLCNTKNIKEASKLVAAFHVTHPVNKQRPITIKQGNETLSLYPAFNPKLLLPSHLNWEKTELINLINHAKHRILIQVMQYSPIHKKRYWGELDNALRAAALRGVSIKLIFADWSINHPNTAFLKSLAVIPNIQLKISTLPPYSNGFIPFARVEHCKYMVIDNNISWIETGNWTWEYFYGARNIAVIIHGNSPALTLSKVFDTDWNGPYTKTISLTRHYKKPKVS